MRPGSTKCYRLIIALGDAPFTEVAEIRAVNDGTAVRLADERREGRAAELWKTYRVVMTWRADATA